MKSIGSDFLLFIGGIFVFFLIPKISGILAIIAGIWALFAVVYSAVRIYYWLQDKRSGYA